MDTSILISTLGVIVAILMLLITILEKWNIISPKLGAISFINNILAKSKFNVSRRKLIAGGILAVGLSIIYSYRFFHIPKVTSPSKWSKFKEVKGFVVNKKTGIIHFRELCGDHLPAQTTSIDSSITKRIHTSKKMQITRKLIGSIPDHLAEELLIDCIMSSPTSTHLYKYLIKIWGRRKEYEKIHDFLKTNILYLKHKLDKSTNSKEIKKITKALTELETRKGHAEYLANMSKFI